MKFSKIYITLALLGVLSSLGYLFVTNQEGEKTSKPLQQQTTTSQKQSSDNSPTSVSKPQSKNEDSIFELEQALEKGDHRPILERIDRDEIDVDHTNSAGMTLLMQALDYDQPEFAFALIQRGADLLASDQSGADILTQALLLGETKITQMALENGADANTELDLIGSSLLMYAAQEGLNEEVKLLIEHGARVNHQNERGETALMWASDMGQYSTAELLLSHQAKPELKNQEGLSARDMALKRGLDQLAMLLRP